MIEQEILKVYKMNKKVNCVSLKKLFNSIREVYKDYCETEKLLREQFTKLTFFHENYILDHYDYKKNRIIFNNGKTIDSDNNFYHNFQRKGKAISFNFNETKTIDSERYSYHYFQKKGKFLDFNNNDKTAEFLYYNHEFEILDAINAYEEFREFKTINPKNISCINSNLLLNIGDSSMELLSLNKDNKELAHVTLKYNKSTSMEACSKKIISYFKRNQNALLNTIQVNIDDLPEWCKQAIVSYDEKHSNIFNKFFNKADEIINEKDINITKNNDFNRDLKEISDNIEDMINRYSVLSAANDNYKRLKISPDILFKEVDDHLEINEKYKPNLKFIDLSLISFKNVLVSGVDFTDTNIEFINPQEVYNKDLSYCTFADKDKQYNNVPFSYLTNFNGVNLCGTVIYGNSDFRYNLDGAITDDDTKIIYSQSVAKL